MKIINQYKGSYTFRIVKHVDLLIVSYNIHFPLKLDSPVSWGKIKEWGTINKNLVAQRKLFFSKVLKTAIWARLTSGPLLSSQTLLITLIICILCKYLSYGLPWTVGPGQLSCCPCDNQVLVVVWK